jgi:hypothetical protein
MRSGFSARQRYRSRTLLHSDDGSDATLLSVSAWAQREIVQPPKYVTGKDNVGLLPVLIQIRHEKRPVSTRVVCQLLTPLLFSSRAFAKIGLSGGLAQDSLESLLSLVRQGCL